MLQFYPESDDQVHLALSMAMKAGFGGGLVVDYPNSRKAKKFFLCLMVGGGGGEGKKEQVPQGLEGEGGERARNEMRREKVKSGKRRAVKDEKGGKEWILNKKALYRKRGKEE